MSDIGYSVAGNLPSELLWEILTRLTCMKSAMRCKAVCKSWLSVILSPQFMGRLLRKHVYGNHEAINLSPPPPFGLIIRPKSFDPSKGQLLYPKNTEFGFSGHFLPNLFSTITSNDFGPQLKVIATCNDLILCGDDYPNQSDHMYICNARTMKWIALPRPPRPYSRIFAGFACDPYNCKEDEQVMDYSVVMVTCDGSNGYVKNAFRFETQFFSSLIGKWKEVTLSLPKRFNTGITCRSLFNDCMLYFYDRCLGVIAFDPKISNSEKEKGDDKLSIACQFIDWPLDFVKNAMEMPMTACLCQGKLRLIQKKGTSSLSVWDLKDYGTGEWQVKYKVAFTDTVSHDFSLYLFAFTGTLSLLGFQPFDDVTLYICLKDRIVASNLKTMRLQDMFTIPDETKTCLPIFRSFDLFRPFWLTL